MYHADPWDGLSQHLGPGQRGVQAPGQVAQRDGGLTAIHPIELPDAKNSHARRIMPRPSQIAHQSSFSTSSRQALEFAFAMGTSPRPCLTALAGDAISLWWSRASPIHKTRPLGGTQL